MIAPGRDACRAAGRLCLVDFAGDAPSPALERLVDRWHLGGVVLFRKNVASSAQVAVLTSALQAIAREAGAPPLWVAVDHEGGSVTRFPPRLAMRLPGAQPGPAVPQVTPLPAAMAIGAGGDPALARAAGRVAGRELRAMGIHLNFAPVLDVNTTPSNPVIGSRAFGDSAALVETLGLACIAGLQDAGVAATAKHFPGHGDTAVDSHLGLPRVEHDLRRLEAVELAPFAAAVRAGVAGLVTAHIVYPALDPSGVPATISAPILTGLLRERWRYEGLVFSDSMSMRAIADHYGIGEAAVAAVRAGCDMVLALGPEGVQEEALERLARAIERGEIPGARVAESLARAAAAAGQWGVGATGPAGEAGAADLSTAVGTLEHDRVAREIAAAAVTLVRDRCSLIPVRGERLAVVTVPAAFPEGQRPDLASALRRHGATVDECSPEDPAVRDGCVAAVTCTRGTLDAAAVAVVRALHRKAGDRLAVVATGDPYDLMQFPEIPAYLATYGPEEPSLDAAALVLLGKARARGRLPVSLPGVLG